MAVRYKTIIVTEKKSRKSRKLTKKIRDLSVANKCDYIARRGWHLVCPKAAAAAAAAPHPVQIWAEGLEATGSDLSL